MHTWLEVRNFAWHRVQSRTPSTSNQYSA